MEPYQGSFPPSFCLNIPAPSQNRFIGENEKDSVIASRRFVFISENIIIHTAGNSIQLSSLPQSVHINGLYDSSPTSDEDAPSLISASSNEESINGAEYLVATTELGRGISCFDYNTHCGRVAYSPRCASPPIFIRSIQDKSCLCQIDGGVSVEYIDISFSRDGTIVAAIGKGSIDSTLFVWKLVHQDKENATTHPEPEFPISGLLLAKHQFKTPISKCLLNPRNSTEIAVLSNDGKEVFTCHLSKIKDSYKITERKCCIADINNSTKNSFFSTVSWDPNSRSMLVGNSQGSILEMKESAGVVSWSEILMPNEASGSVRSIIFTSSHMIVGYESGQVSWFETDTKSKFCMIRSVHKVQIGSELVDIACSPDFLRILALSKDGRLNLFWTDLDKNQQEEKMKKSNHQIKARSCAQIHEGVVSALATVVLTGNPVISLLVTGSIDGTINAWQDSSNTSGAYLQRSIVCLDIGSPVTVIIALEGAPVIVVGSANGEVKFIYVGRKKDTVNTTHLDGSLDIDMIELKSEILCCHPVTNLAFNMQTKKVVAGCYESCQAFVLCAEPSNLHIIGVVQTINQSHLTSCDWCKENPDHLLVSSVDGQVLCFDTMPMCFSSEPISPLWTVQISDVSYLKEIVGGGGKIYGIGTNSYGIDCFELPINIERDSEDSLKLVDVASKSQCVGGMSKGGSVLEYHEKMKSFLVGSMAGEVFIYSLSGQSIECIWKKQIHSGPILSMAISGDKSRLYTCSTDGSLFVSILPIATAHDIKQPSHEYDYLIPSVKRNSHASNKCDSIIQQRQKSWLCKANEKMNQNVPSLQADDRTSSSLQERIRSLVQSITKMREENEQLGYDERLDDSEFIINIANSSKLKVNVNQGLQHESRETVMLQNQDDERFISNLRKAHIDNMKEQLCTISEISLSSSESAPLVPNFPIRVLIDKEKTKIERIKKLRLNEITEMHRNINKSSKDGHCWTQLLMDTSDFTPTFIIDLSNEIRKKIDRGHESKTDDSIENVGTNMPGSDMAYNSLLYPPLAIRTPEQMRTQIALLQHIERSIKSKFNKTFYNLKHKKNETLVSINRSIDRLKEVSTELESLTEITYPTNHDFSIEERFVKSLSNTEGNENVSTEIYEKLEKEATLSRSDMVGEQVRDVGRLECKDREKMQENEAQRENLVTECENINTEINDLVSSFNENLNELRNSRFTTQRTIVCIDMYILILTEAILREKDNALMFNNLQSEVNVLEKQWADTNFMLSIKQGQDESQHIAKIFDDNDNDAIFISSDPIEESNSVILRKGVERKKVLQQISDLRQIIKSLSWEYDLLKLRSNHQQELYTDYQLLRLTNDLKSLLRCSKDDSRKKVTSTQDQIKKKIANHEMNTSKLHKQNQGITKQISSRQKETTQLKDQLLTLKNTVEEKEEMLKTVDKPDNKRIHKIMKRAKLVNLVHSQAVTLKELQSELDKLQQKTYPCFSAPKLSW